MHVSSASNPGPGDTFENSSPPRPQRNYLAKASSHRPNIRQIPPSSRKMGKSTPKPAAKGKETKGKETKKDASASSSSDAKGKGKGKDDKLKPANSLNVRHILCEKHSKMETVLERLGNGEKFDTVARELSEDKARQGGSLGWKIRGSLLKDFEDAAYALQVSTVDKPIYTNPAIKTSEGYHCIMVEGRK